MAALTVLAGNGAAEEPGGRRLVGFSLPTISGERFDLSPHLGKDVVLVSFWATWCKPCKTELSLLAPLWRELKGQGFLLVAVSIDGPDTVSEVEGFQKKNGYDFPIVLDTQTEVLARLNPRGDVPFSVLVDRSGAIVETHQGFNPGDEGPLREHLVALLAEGQAASGERQGAFIEGTNTLRFSYLHDNDNGRDTDDRVYLLQNRLSLGATLEPLSIGARIDNTVYPGYDREARCDGDTLLKCPWQDDHRIERFAVAYTTPELEIRGGDFVQSLGRGLVLSVRKVDELGLDTAIRGGLVRAELGPVSARALAGISNIQNTDTAVLGRLEEQDDLIAAGEVSVALPHRMTVGLRGSYFDYDEAGNALRDESDWTVGASFEARQIADVLSLALEGAVLQNLTERRSLVTGKTTDESAFGSAFYASAALTPLSGLSILLEYKDYRRFVVQDPRDDVPLVYVEPPTLERYDQIVPSTTNASGGRALVQYLIPDVELLTYVNVLYYAWAGPDAFDWDQRITLSDDDDGYGALHLYGGLERRWESGWSVAASGGWRLEGRNRSFGAAFTDDYDGEQPAFNRRLWHIEGEAHIPLVGPHSLAVAAQHRSEEKALPPNIKHFVRGDASLTYSMAPHLSVALLYTYEDEGATDTEAQFLNLAGEVTWRLGDWGQVSLFGGRNTGGIICVSGVCRSLPPFFGTRAEFVARF